MWSQIGTDEYKNAFQKAKAILAEYKTNGIININNPDVIAILQGK